MRRKGRILLMDDDKRWLAELSAILEGEGFYAKGVETSAQALEQLDKELYHLAVLDINLEDANPINAEGMNLLQNLNEAKLQGAIGIIMLSAFGTKDQMRSAFRKHKVIDFLDKNEFEEGEFLNLIRRIFGQEVQVNLDLDIRWNEVEGPDQAVVNLEVDGVRVKESSDLQAQMAVELDDLLCRLFFEAKSIIVDPLTRGHGGAAILLVRRFFNGVGQPVIVKFGDFHTIESEYNNFREYVQNYIGGYRSSIALGLDRTPHLGGITYSFLGDHNDRIESFTDFYARSEIAEIKEALDNLFKETCGAWYTNHDKPQPHNLTSDYQKLFRLTPEILSRALNERLKMVQFKHKLIFKSLDNERTFTNPISAVANKSFTETTYICITHGDLNGDNVLVDNLGHTWIIDFLFTGPGHYLRDFAKLDAVIRFQLLAAEDASLEERFMMEEALCKAESLGQAAESTLDFQTDNPALAKAYASAVHLRSLAHRLLVNDPRAETREYNIASLYCALNTIRFYSLPTLQLQHALLSASLLAERLGLK